MMSWVAFFTLASCHSTNTISKAVQNQKMTLAA